MQLLFAGVLLAPIGSYAQELARTFEVASVKLANGRRGAYLVGGPGSNDPIHFEFRGASMGALLRRAYGVNSYQLSTPAGLPGSYFDIEARIPPNTGEREFEEMLRNLLIDRFNMKSHREVRDLPGYEIVVARSGLRMKPAEPPARDLPDIPVGKLPLIKDSDGELQLPFGRKARLVIRLSDGRFRQSGRIQSMADITEMCSRELGRPVLDHTGLSGAYDFNVDFARVLDEPADAHANDPSDDVGSPFVTAFQSQLGLRLLSKKVAVDVVVIDQIRSTPTGN